MSRSLAAFTLFIRAPLMGIKCVFRNSFIGYFNHPVLYTQTYERTAVNLGTISKPGPDNATISRSIGLIPVHRRDDIKSSKMSCCFLPRWRVGVVCTRIRLMSNQHEKRLDISSINESERVREMGGAHVFPSYHHTPQTSHHDKTLLQHTSLPDIHG